MSSWSFLAFFLLAFSRAAFAALMSLVSAASSLNAVLSLSLTSSSRSPVSVCFDQILIRHRGEKNSTGREATSIVWRKQIGLAQIDVVNTLSGDHVDDKTCELIVSCVLEDWMFVDVELRFASATCDVDGEQDWEKQVTIQRMMIEDVTVRNIKEVTEPCKESIWERRRSFALLANQTNAIRATGARVERRPVAEDDACCALPTLGSSFAFWRIDMVRFVAITMLSFDRSTCSRAINAFDWQAQVQKEQKEKNPTQGTGNGAKKSVQPVCCCALMALADLPVAHVILHARSCNQYLLLSLSLERVVLATRGVLRRDSGNCTQVA
ncbi:hypothetical protein KCV06_g35, partial [Aureobasidium melanogenum]